MFHKSAPARVKAAGEVDGLGDGEFEAIVSVFGNVDWYGDRVMPGAFKDTLAEWKERGDPIPVVWSHRYDDPDYHVGIVTDAEERDEGLWVRGRLDLDDDAAKARQVYRLLKGRRVTQFSFSYDIDDADWAKEPSDDGGDVYELRKLKLHEVGPTLIGANPDTELLGVKAPGKAAIAAHATATSDASWDGPATEAKLSNDDGAATFRKAYAWVDDDGDPDAKSSYKFIHHEVDADGNVGAANLQACVTGIGVLNGGRGGTVIPDADREGVWRHLAKHLRDAGQEPAELKRRTVAGAKAGRVLSAKNETALRDSLTQIEASAKTIRDVLAQLTTNDDGKATTSEPVKDEEPDGVKSEEPTRCSPADVRLLVDLAEIG